MRFGPVPPSGLPTQDPDKVLLTAERWQRATWAHDKWAEPAKRCVDFFWGRQWTQEQIAAMRGRPAFKFNMIEPIVRLVLGYQRANKLNNVLKPGHDTQASEAVGEVLTKLEREIATSSGMEFVDGEVFLDGLLCGRGWYYTYLDWTNNNLGEAKTKSVDPFRVLVDPDADTYDINETASYMQYVTMVSIDEIEATFGREVAALVRPYTMGQTPLTPLASVNIKDMTSPIRDFGQREDGDQWFDSFYTLMGNFVDTHRKTIRLIETQHKVREPRDVFIDLETGDDKVIPLEWGRDKVEKCLLAAELVGNPLIVQRRLVERIQWETTVGDLILYDKPSYYDSYTLTGYFPMFQRGVAGGMVDNLIDPQLEKNKRRNARIEIESKTANGGWIHNSKALNPVQKGNLKKFGSQPGVIVEYDGGPENEPKQIQAHQPPVGARILEEDANADMRSISGINEAALGSEDNRATSGKAIEARQRQATLSIQVYMDNFRRSKRMVAERHLEIIQRWYTEKRIYRVTGDDGKQSQLVINQLIQDPLSVGKRVLNDVQIGKYMVTVDDAPASATYQAAQFEEMMDLVERMAKNGVPIAPFADLILQASSLQRKDEWIKRFQAVMGGGAPPAPGMPGPGGQPMPAPGQPPQPQGNVVPMPTRGG